MSHEGPIQVPYGTAYADELEEMYFKYVEPKLTPSESRMPGESPDYSVNIIQYLWKADHYKIKVPMKYKHMVLEFIETEPNAIGLDDELDLDNMFI